MFYLKARLTGISPNKYYKTLGLSLRGFSFTFPDVSDSLKTLFEPSQDLIYKKTGREEISSVPTQYFLFPQQKAIEDAIKNLNDVSVKYFINESYFLFDKSALIKETFITAIQKKFQFMAQSATSVQKLKIKKFLKFSTN